MKKPYMNFYGFFEEISKKLGFDKPPKFNEIFTDSFIREHSRFPNYIEFFKASGYTSDTPNVVPIMTKADLDLYISNTTDFNNWDEMFECAAKKYTKKN